MDQCHQKLITLILNYCFFCVIRVYVSFSCTLSAKNSFYKNEICCVPDTDYELSKCLWKRRQKDLIQSEISLQHVNEISEILLIAFFLNSKIANSNNSISKLLVTLKIKDKIDIDEQPKDIRWFSENRFYEQQKAADKLFKDSFFSPWSLNSLPSLNIEFEAITSCYQLKATIYNYLIT